MLVGLSIIAFAIALPITLQWQLKFILVFAIFSIVASFYFIPQLNLRAVPLLKACYVSLLWAFSTTIFPLLLINAHYSDMVLLAIERFLFILPLCIIFNVRDIAVDRASQISTIPVLYGVKPTKFVSIALTLALAVLVTLQSPIISEHSQINLRYSVALLVSCFTTVIVLLQASEEKDEFYYMFSVDGMILLQSFLCVIIGII